MAIQVINVGTVPNDGTGNVGIFPGSTQPFGYVANMFFYTAKLTQEQLQQNYYGLKSRFGV
jgi:hypothetical protein